MALSPTTAWTSAFSRSDVEPRLLVDIYDGSTHYYCLDGKSDVLDYSVAISSVDTMSAELDPLTRKAQTGTLSIVVQDTWIRPIHTSVRLKNKPITVKIGARELAASDYLSLFHGVIDHVQYGNEGCLIEAIDLFGYLGLKSVGGYWYNKHPLDTITEIFTTCDIPSALINTSSFDPSNYTGSISHFCWTRAAGGTNAYNGSVIHGSGLDPSTQPAFDLIDDIVKLINGQISIDEDGKLKFTLFDASSAAVDHWDSDIFGSIEQETGDIINQIVIPAKGTYVYAGRNAEFDTSYVSNDSDSQSTYAYPGESKRVLSETINCDFYLGSSPLELFSDMTDSTTTVVLKNVHAMSGCIFEGGSQPAWATPSVARPVYVRIEDEIIKITSAGTFDLSVTGGSQYASYQALYGYPKIGQFTCARAQLGTTAAAHSASFSGAIAKVRDITMPVHCTTSKLARYANGLQLVKLSTGLAQLPKQTGDLITLEYDGYSEYGLDGITEGDAKFEILKKEVDLMAGEIKWLLAMASLSSITESREIGVVRMTPGLAAFQRAGDTDISEPFVTYGFAVTEATTTSVAISAGSITDGSDKFQLPSSVEVDLSGANKDHYLYFDLHDCAIAVKTVASGAGEPTQNKSEIHIAIVASDGLGNIDTINQGSMPTSGIGTASILTGAITTAKIYNGAITADKIGSNAVTTAKIYAGAVTSAKIASEQIDTTHLIGSAVTSDILASSSVTAAKIGTGAVTETKLGDMAVSMKKLNPSIPKGGTGCNWNSKFLFSASSPPPGWYMHTGTSSNVTVDNTVFLSGGQSMKIDATSEASILVSTQDGSGNGNFVAVKENQGVFVRAHVRATSIASGDEIAIYLEKWDEDKSLIGSETVFISELNAADTWQNIGWSYTVESGVYFLTIRCGTSGSGFVAYFDEVDLKILPVFGVAFLDSASTQTSAGNWVEVEYDYDTYYDLSNAFDTATFHFVSPKSAFYKIEAQAELISVPNGGYCQMRLMWDPVTPSSWVVLTRGVKIYNNSGGSATLVVPASAIAPAVEGVNIKAEVYCSSTVYIEDENATQFRFYEIASID